ncbi:hypothetical protein B834_870 [Enterococcus mundtii 1A]|uniref:hypothetical protein n=1 Tax=Enterococcus mundtii TaxID=53346 RepID=UPI0023041EE5|nr:hypothetical protein [Enterococcus mundtii]MDA9428400.1 hypothetical protein [Enterococcus mundtii 1A]
MSKLKVGDNVFYKGDEGIIREVMIDGKEDFYRVDVSKKSIHYLYEDELDLVTQKLNDNQKVVLEWLKLTAPTGKPMQVVFWMMNNAAWGHLDELRDPLLELTDDQQFEVLAAFAQWGLEQEAVNEK